MTAQISDTLLHLDINFAIAGTSGTFLFDPTSLPFKPISMNSACWRGYVAHYSIFEQRLYLNSLKLGLPPDRAIRARAGRGVELFGVMPKTDGGMNVLYEGFSMPILFTGGLLLADSFIQAFYIHMGFHPAWKYKQVREVIFEAGRIIKDHDRSVEMSALREDIANHWESSKVISRLQLHSEVSDRMKTCFLYDYAQNSSHDV